MLHRDGGDHQVHFWDHDALLQQSSLSSSKPLCTRGIEIEDNHFIAKIGYQAQEPGWIGVFVRTRIELAQDDARYRKVARVLKESMGQSSRAPHVGGADVGVQ